MDMSFEQKLQNYAELVVKIGVGLRAGQRLMVRAPVESAPLVRLIVASAYKAGARLVDVLWTDDARGFYDRQRRDGYRRPDRR